MEKNEFSLRQGSLKVPDMKKKKKATAFMLYQMANSRNSSTTSVSDIYF